MMKLSVNIIVKALLASILICLAVLVVVKTIQIRSVEKSDVEAQASVALSANSRVLLAGEVFWGRYIRDASLASEQDYQYPFTQLNTFDRNNYDSWLAHMECPITDNNLTSVEQEATLTFNCRPEFLVEASKWFDVFSLANNHTDNMGGQAGLDETRQHLEDYDIQYYGHYSNTVLDELCEVVSLPAKISYSDGATIREELPVAMCGYHNVFALPTEGQLDVISDYSKYFLTIVTPQMGQEYVPSADEFKTNTYRAMIDRGADMVVATHPHWVQNTEVYKGRLIMYSLGNFMFDQQDNEEVRRSAALDLVITTEKSSETAKWRPLASKCGLFNDDCLKEAEEQDLQKPSFSLSYDIVSSLNTSYVTSLAPEDVHLRILERLNWAQTANQLGADYPAN